MHAGVVQGGVPAILCGLDVPVGVLGGERVQHLPPVWSNEGVRGGHRGAMGCVDPSRTRKDPLEPSITQPRKTSQGAKGVFPYANAPQEPLRHPSTHPTGGI